MNEREKILFRLRADLARTPGSGSDADLAALLAEAVAESDASLRSAAELAGLDLGDLEERAGVLEVDGGLPRTSANLAAFALALRARVGEIGERPVRWLFANAEAILAWERAAGTTRAETARALRAALSRQPPPDSGAKKAVCGREEAIW